MRKDRILLVDPDKLFEISKYLCRYQTINEKLYNSLINNTLWFSSLNNFNDPFDCNLIEDFTTITFDELYKSLQIDNKRSGLNWDDKQIIERAKILFDNPNEIRDICHSQRDAEREKVGICCFSEEPDINLFWSHYAGSHKGICLRFDITGDADFFLKDTYKVEYINKSKKTNLIKEQAEKGFSSAFKYHFATKINDWAYEKEVRVIKEGSGNVRFKKEALVEIIFGSKTIEDEINSIKDIVKKHDYKVDFYKAVLNNNDFNLDFHMI